MDYKYIELLLERYWACNTSLEEEEILRAFFCQKEVPASLLPYRDLFVYEHEARKTEVLGDDFDQKILAMTEGKEAPKAKTISLKQRLMPLFRAAAIVAIILTLGNAMQVAIEQKAEPAGRLADTPRPHEGVSVAVVKTDSAKMDTLQQRGVTIQPVGLIK